MSTLTFGGKPGRSTTAPSRRSRRATSGVAALLGVLALALAVAAVDADAEPAGDVADIPLPMLASYRDAAASCPGLPWEVLAAVGWVESRHGFGRVDAATGEVRPHIEGPPLDGTNGTMELRDPLSPDGWMRAQGPMQFLPTTWQEWGRLGPRRPAGAVPSPHNAFDAIASAADYLCGPRGAVTDLAGALRRYNNDGAYVRAVLATARAYGWPDPGGPTSPQVTTTVPPTSSPGEPPPGAVADGLHCPVAGPVEVHDDFGELRDDGRPHEGNDLVTLVGVPVLAPERGTVTRATDGRKVVRGDSGTVWVLVHNPFDDLGPPVEEGQRVDRGQLLARVGRSGMGIGLVHVERRPDGGPATDAYTLLAEGCRVATP